MICVMATLCADVIINHISDTNVPSLFKLCPDLDFTEPGFGAVGGGGRAFSEPERECRIPSSDDASTTTLKDI